MKNVVVKKPFFDEAEQVFRNENEIFQVDGDRLEELKEKLPEFVELDKAGKKKEVAGDELPKQ